MRLPRHRFTSLPGILLVATLCAGCAPAGAAILEQDVETEDLRARANLDALAEVQAGAQLRDAVLAVDGRVVGHVAAVHHDEETGEIALTFVGGASDYLLSRLAAESGGDKSDMPDLVLTGLDEEDEIAEITLVGAQAKEISFSELDASSGKDLFDVSTSTFWFETEEVKHAHDASAPVEPSQGEAWSSEVDVAGLDPKVLDGFTLLAHQATERVDGEASWVMDELTITGGPEGYDAAVALVAAGEVVPVAMVLTDGATGRRTEMVTRGKPVKATRKPLQWTMDLVVEQQTISIYQKL